MFLPVKLYIYFNLNFSKLSLLEKVNVKELFIELELLLLKLRDLIRTFVVFFLFGMLDKIKFPVLPGLKFATIFILNKIKNVKPHKLDSLRDSMLFLINSLSLILLPLFNLSDIRILLLIHWAIVDKVSILINKKM